MTQFVSFILALTSLTVVGAIPSLFKEPKSVPNLNVSGLTGRWYGMYTTALIANVMNSPFCAVTDVTAKDLSTSDSSSLPISNNKLTLDVNVHYNAKNANGTKKHLSGLIVDEDTTADGAFMLSLTTGDIPPMDSIPGQMIGRGGNILDGQLDSGSSGGEMGDLFGNDMLGSAGSDANSAGAGSKGGNGNGNLRGSNTFLSLRLPLYVIAAGDLGPAAPGDIAVTEASGGNQQDIGASSDSAQQQQYPWIVLSGPLQLNYLVLARDPERFKNEFQDRVTSLLSEKNIVLPPVPLFQSKTDCNYPAVGTTTDGSLGPVVPPDMFPLPADGTGTDSNGGSGGDEGTPGNSGIVPPPTLVEPQQPAEPTEPVSDVPPPPPPASASADEQPNTEAGATGAKAVPPATPAEQPAAPAAEDQPPARAAASSEEENEGENVVPGTVKEKPENPDGAAGADGDGNGDGAAAAAADGDKEGEEDMEKETDGT